MDYNINQNVDSYINNMGFNSSAQFQGDLNNKETILWSGQPKRGIVFTAKDIFLIPFSLIWCGFAIFWIIMALNIGAPFYFTMFGIPFVILGLILVFGRFIIDAKQRAHTFYGLTNERIIIKSGVYKKSVKSINISTISDIEYTEKSDGSGTLYLGPKTPILTQRNKITWDSGITNTSANSLALIPEVKSVYNKIINIQKSYKTEF